MKITTKTGDRGETGLFGGERVAKNDLLIEVIGELDELTSFLGWAGRGGEYLEGGENRWEKAGRSVGMDNEKGRRDREQVLLHLQDDIYRIMGFFGMNFKWASYINPISEEDVIFLEEEMERWKILAGVSEDGERATGGFKFIRPGSSELSGRLHICRSVCRRVERGVVALGKARSESFGGMDGEVSEEHRSGAGRSEGKVEKGACRYLGEILKYLNRLSDLLFVMAYGFEIEVKKYQDDL